MEERENIPGEEARKKFLQKVEALAHALGKPASIIRKMLNAEAANKMFEKNENLRKWEQDTFPDTNNADGNDG